MSSNDLKHTFVSGVSDGADATLVRPSNWNADHIPKVGASSSDGRLPVLAHINVTPVGNVGGGEDDLMKYTLPAGALGTNGDTVEVLAIGTRAGTFTLKFYFGATAIYSKSMAAGTDWRLEGEVWRTGAATQAGQVRVFVTTSGATWVDDLLQVASPTETLSGAVVLGCTATGSSNNDGVQSFFRVLTMAKP